MKPSQGLTLIEALIILAIVGIIASLALVYGGRALKAQQERSVLSSFQQIVWQGATAAAARNTQTELRRSGQELELINLESGKTLQSMSLLDDVSTTLPEGTVLSFLPPGKVALASLRSFGTRQLSTSNKTFNLSISVIGEVSAEVAP